jgi:hypothetical protein
MKIVNLLVSGVLLLALGACEKEKVDNKTVTVKVETVKDIPANPSDAPSPNYTFFSFENGIVDKADSASTKWDIAFRSTGIIVNGGTSGPGSTQGALYDGIFDELKEVPSSVTLISDSQTAKAFGSGSGNSWYNYSSTTHLITPVAGKILFAKTSAGNYAKVEILSYYKGAPATPGAESVGRYYTIRYAYQKNGTKTFE